MSFFHAFKPEKGDYQTGSGCLTGCRLYYESFSKRIAVPNIEDNTLAEEYVNAAKLLLMTMIQMKCWPLGMTAYRGRIAGTHESLWVFQSV